jgi:hypothetical protein
MKRSEMVKKVLKHFESLAYPIVEEAADRILSHIESCGMCPPPVYYEGKFGWYSKHEWEPENATQNHSTYCDNNVELASAERPLR